MKKLLMASLLPFAAFCADFYNTSFGFNAGVALSATNESTVAVGDTAAYNASFVDSVLLGSAAGVFGGGSNVVAIGYGASACKSGDNRTEINNQISISPDGFWLKTDPASGIATAPVCYSGGALYLTADRIFAISPSAPAPAGCDFYVSAFYGDDAASGASASAPLATIDAAIARCTTNGQTVCALPGRYPFPEYFACTNAAATAAPSGGLALHFIAPGGKANTIIDASLNATNIVPCVWGPEGEDFLSFDGFTFIGARYEGGGQPRFYGAYTLAKFDNCAFAGEMELYAFGRAYFNYCAISNCTADLHLYSTTNSFTELNYGRNEIMEEVYVADSVFSIDTQNTATGEATYPNFGCHDYLENSYFDIGGLNEIPAGHGACDMAGGAKPGATNTTFVVDCMVKQKTIPTVGDCIIGIGADGKFKETGNILSDPAVDWDFSGDNVVSSAAGIRASMKNFRPTVPAWRFYGYESPYDRALRDEIFDRLAEKYGLTAVEETTEE